MHTKTETSPEVVKSDVALREEAIQAFWEEHDIFNKTLQYPGGTSVGSAQLSDSEESETKADKDFVFYDGPPFATGLPHYGHILAGTIKDAVPRFWTMNGYRVRRKWGWDCHGLPLENLIEKKLGLATKRDIEDYGVQNFNEAARDAVLEYRDDWKQIIPRMGRWVDMEDDYRTMDSSYTESVWWVFSELNKKGLVYEGFKGMHLCPRCGTTLSNFEVNQGYKDIKDIAVTVKLPLIDDPDTSLLVWTTTPWTLPGNMAAAVHNDHEYVKVKVSTEEGDEQVMLAKARLEQLGDVEYEVLTTCKGSELVGKTYEPPFSYWKEQEFENKGNAWTIYHADYVELGEEGTGAVHLAPAYGDEDMQLAKEHDIPIVHHVDSDGHFMEFVSDFKGQLVKPKDDDDAGVTHLDADIEIVKALKANGRLFKKENISHSYPHCWRCDTPLLNYATTSWFVDVPSIKDQLVKENSKVHWVPDHVGHARFGKWLENARDWAVSRQRYWGAPLPIWKNPSSGEVKIFGSLGELQEHAPKRGNTYHLMRHGESTKNVQNLVTDDPDAPFPLTEKGKADVAKSAETLKGKIDLIYVSPVMRARETAEIVAKTLGLSEEQVVVDDRILETDHGEYEGKSFDEFVAAYPRSIERFTDKPEGGESWGEIRKRTGDFIYEIDSTHKDKNILVVSHGVPLLMLKSVMAGLTNEESLQAWDDLYPTDKGVPKEVAFTPMPHNDNYALDFHRPYIDNFEAFDADGTKLERIPDVFDCWFESGSMPYAETHYPFENLDVANIAEGVRFPADFISEAVDQTRGWFYSLIVLGVALFGKAPFQNVITNGLVLAEDGKKMSKSLKNYPDPVELVHRQGADAMRFYLLSSPIIKGEDLNFSEKEVQELQRKNVGRLHNVLAMYTEYAEEGVELRLPAATAAQVGSDSTHVLDRWIIARLNQLISEATAGYKNYELDKATRPITDFIDDLSVWYLRRSRDRLKSDDVADKAAALLTLRFVLQNLAKVMAPSMPFYAEYLWQEIKGEDDEESVHLSAWPEAGEVDDELIAEMQIARNFVSIALELRVKAGHKVRQPLSALTLEGKSFKESALQSVIADEVNVKTVAFGSETSLDTEVTPALQMEGDAREFMRAVQGMRKDMDLSPKDRVVLTVKTSYGGEVVIKTFHDEIVKTVGADAINFGDAGGNEVKAGEHEFTVEVQKV